MTHWIERAEQELDDAYERGDLTSKEYQEAMRDLRQEAQDAAHEAAEDAFWDAMGGR